MDPQTLESPDHESTAKRVLTFIGVLSVGIGLLVLAIVLDTLFPGGRPPGGSGWGAVIASALVTVFFVSGPGHWRGGAWKTLLTVALGIACAGLGFYEGLGTMFEVIFALMAVGVAIEERAERKAKI